MTALPTPAHGVAPERDPSAHVANRKASAELAKMIPRDQLAELNRLSPWRPVADAATCWACIFGAWVACTLWPSPWVFAGAFLLVGNRFYGLFILGHDALHRRLFASRRLNDRFADLLIFGPIGAITRINNRNHLLHHARLGRHDDPDRHKYACFNKAHWAPMLGFLTGVTAVTRSAANVFLSKSKEQEKDQAGDRYTVTDAVILIGWQAGLITGLTLAIGWWAYPALWLAPVYGLTILADNLRSFCEHSHPEADEEADTHRLITYDSFWPERPLLAPMSMNRHAAHHLWPTIPYYRLTEADRRLRAAVEANPDAPPIHWRRSYAAYLASYLMKMPIEACRAARTGPGDGGHPASLAPASTSDTPNRRRAA